MLNSPYVTHAPPVSLVMLKVLAALLPAITVYVYFYGIGIVVQLGLATLTAWLAEYVMLKARGYKVMPFLLDGSATVTAWLLALSFPPLAPWWLIIIACAFAIIIAKHLYGGIGNNLFNPAMVGYAMMIIAFPAYMSRYAAPGLISPHSLNMLEEVQYIFLGILPQNVSFDAIVCATPLNIIKTALLTKTDIRQVLDQPLFGLLGGVGMEWVSLAYLVGGLLLLQQRLISWQIPAGFLLGIGSISGLLYLYDAAHYMSPWFHLLSGGTMLGAFFIATDPVTGPTTPVGRLIFAVLIGMLTYIIRVFGGFPDGVAFAVLIMNIAVPFIDQYTQPSVFGHHIKKREA
jgi:electron transport complex protein RnfD